MASPCLMPGHSGLLGVLFGDGLAWGQVAQSPVRALSVVAAQPVQKMSVEAAQVVGQQVFLKVHQFLLHSPVEAFIIGVHLRAFWISVAMPPALLAGEVVEGAGELAAIVCEHLLDWRREHALHETGKAGGIGAVGAWNGNGEGKTAGVVGRSEDVAPAAVSKAHDGVKGDALADDSGSQVAPEARLGAGLLACLDAPFGVKALRCDAHLVRRVGNQPGNGANARAHKAVLGAPWPHQHANLARPEVWIKQTKGADVFNQSRRPAPAPAPAWRPAAVNQAGQTAAAQGCAPGIECGTADAGVIPGCIEAVFFPEYKGVAFLSGCMAHVVLL